MALLLSLAILWKYVILNEAGTIPAKFIYVNWGDTVILKHSNHGYRVDWFGPSNSFFARKTEVIDAYGRKTLWTTSKYSSGNYIHSGLNSVSIVGNSTNYEYFLRVFNFTIANEGLYYCSYFREYDVDKEQFIVHYEDINALKIHPDDLTASEGTEVKVCCSSNALLPHEYIRWYKPKAGKELTELSNYTCLRFPDIDRNDSGIYTCLIENGAAVRNTTINVLYPPSVTIKYENNKDNGRIYSLRCHADGNPESYVYGEWQHISFFDEHIRDIQTPERGILRLNTSVNDKSWYHNIGLYICRVANGVKDKDGSFFQTGTATVTYKGPPVIIAKNNGIQYMKDDEPKTLSITVYSESALICNYVTVGEKVINSIDVSMQQKTAEDIFYEKRIRISATEITFDIHNEGFGTYVLTTCNQHGSSSFEVTLKSSAGNESLYANNQKPEAFVKPLLYGSIGTLFVLAVAIAGVYIGKKKKRVRRNAQIEMRGSCVHVYDEIHVNDVIEETARTASVKQEDQLKT